MAQSATRDPTAAALPRWVQPQLTQLVDAAPDGDQWLHEIKFDGYRMHARLDEGAVKLLTRTGLDWTHKYPPIAAAVASLGARRAYLDRELCGVFPDGITSFSMIQGASDPQPDPARLAVLRPDAGEKVLEGGVVRGIARQHLVGERQALPASRPVQ